jgi:mRNA-degrading endonuclease RelE of RelBE toxin-antitoxin system
MSFGYELLIRKEVYFSLTSLKSRTQSKVLAYIERLQENPFQESHESYEGKNGRILKVVSVGEFGIHYWVDHAEKEVRIVDLKPL